MSDYSSVGSQGLDFANQAVLVTGGGSGIGLEVALAFAQCGAHVAILGRRKDRLEAAIAAAGAAGGRMQAVPCDVRDYAQCEAAVAAVRNAAGRLDVLINGAAGNFLSRAEDLSSNAFRTVVDIDLVGSFHMTRAAFPALCESKGCVLSITALLHRPATPFQVHPAAAKAGIEAMTRTLAVEWAHHGIRLNCIAPGPIADTEGIRRLTSQRNRDSMADAAPMRVGTKRDIALGCLFLASRTLAPLISGQTIAIDGAHHMLRAPLVTEAEMDALAAMRSSKKKPARL